MLGVDHYSSSFYEKLSFCSLNHILRFQDKILPTGNMFSKAEFKMCFGVNRRGYQIFEDKAPVVAMS